VAGRALLPGGYGAWVLLCGLGDLIWPGGVRPTGLVDPGEEGVALADAPGEEWVGVGDGPDTDGDGLGCPGGVGAAVPVPDVTGLCPVPLCSDGATQVSSGAAGPPARATATMLIHAATTSTAPSPASRTSLRRRPEGSEKTG
jgi:hypothetical protein